MEYLHQRDLVQTPGIRNRCIDNNETDFLRTNEEIAKFVKTDADVTKFVKTITKK